jgi:hypothetical protein
MVVELKAFYLRIRKTSPGLNTKTRFKEEQRKAALFLSLDNAETVIDRMTI